MVGGGGKSDGEEGGSSSVWNRMDKVKIQLKVKKEGASSSVWNMDKVKSLCMVGLARYLKSLHCGENFTGLQTYHGDNINLKKE